MMDGILLQAAEGLGDEPGGHSGGEIWDLLQAEKEEVAREIQSDGPLCQLAMSGLQIPEVGEESGCEIQWRHRGQLEARLRELNDALDRLMDGAYGRCGDCGAQIGKKRLAADPAVSTCIRCQMSAEAESADSFAYAASY
jgi:RNA polymerase-binding transcription factor DksA